MNLDNYILYKLYIYEFFTFKMKLEMRLLEAKVGMAMF